MRDPDVRVHDSSRGDLLLTTLSLALPVAAYDLLLIERKYSVLFDRGAFLQEPLVGREKLVFALLLFAEVTLLVLTTTALLRALLRRILPGRTWTAVAGLAAAAGYFAAVTIQFDVYRYFKDGIDMGLARDLGGGDLGRALAFVRAELMGLLPLVLGALAAAVGWLWAWRRFGARISRGLGGSRLGWLATWKGILLANVTLLLLPGVVLLASDRLGHTLNHVEAHRLYGVPLVYATDFDGDGYGLLARPIDQAPFDSSRYPYAPDLPGNGIDEDGIGGDLPVATRHEPMPAWDPTRLERRNVLVVVLETARQDLLDTTVDGKPVMPHLAELQGQRLRAISHFGFTGPAVTGILDGTIAEDEKGTSLLDRFHALGYATGVFSGQPEDFSGIASRTGMDRADIRWDAARMDRSQRMYTGSDLNSLVMPGALVTAKFEEWVQTLGSRPFFAYMNLQEMHFPYDSRKIPATLLGDPIPRSRITASNRAWLQRTYWNAAHRVDAVLASAFDALRARGLFDRTLVVVLGDHGEELFDHGYLGHGVNLSHVQNETFLKILNGEIDAPKGPVGISDVGKIVWNALVKDPADRYPLGGPVLAIVGTARTPRQIGLFDEHGLRKYDFRRGEWTREANYGSDPEEMGEDVEVVRAWESYALQLNEEK
jgi:hypothetical protein